MSCRPFRLCARGCRSIPTRTCSRALVYEGCAKASKTTCFISRLHSSSMLDAHSLPEVCELRVVCTFTFTPAFWPYRRHSFLFVSFRAQPRTCSSSSGLSSAFSSSFGQPAALLGRGGTRGRRSGEGPSTGLRLETSMSSENKVRVVSRLT